MTSTLTAATARLPAKAEILRGVAAERRAMLNLLRPLDPAQWDTPTALPGWRIREVVGHVISLDVTAITGQVLPVAFGSMDRLERWNDRQVSRWADRPVPELLVALERWGRRFVRFGRALPSPLYRLRMPTLWGRGPGGLLIWSRVYDEWIHRQDIRRALGMPDEVVDVAPAAEFLLHAMVAAVSPQLREQQGRVRVSLEGTPIPEWTFDLPAGTAGPSDPSENDAAAIRAPANAFLMAASGRDAFDDLLQRGVLILEGDQALGREFLSKTRVV